MKNFFSFKIGIFLLYSYRMGAKALTSPLLLGAEIILCTNYVHIQIKFSFSQITPLLTHSVSFSGASLIVIVLAHSNSRGGFFAEPIDNLTLPTHYLIPPSASSTQKA